MWVRIRPDGTIYGQTDQQGIVVTGDGVATYSGAGTGHMTPDGASVLRGAILHSTTRRASWIPWWSQPWYTRRRRWTARSNTKEHLTEWEVIA